MHVPCRTKKDRDQMVAFLKENYRPFSEVMAGAGDLCEYGTEEGLNDRSYKHTDGIRGPLGDDLSYIPKRSKWYVGFDFGTSGGAEGAWMKDFLRWVATKVGKPLEFEEIEGAVPVIIYDHPGSWKNFDEIWPVLRRSEYNVTKDMRSFLTNDHGFRGWTQSVKQMHARSMEHLEETATKEDWGAKRLEANKQLRDVQTWDHMFKVAKRTDAFVKKELKRLDNLWEARK